MPRSSPPASEQAPDPRRAIPAVHVLLEHPAAQPLSARYGRPRVAAALAEVQAAVRQRLSTGAADGEAVRPEALLAAAAQRLAARFDRGPRRVINATGVILHTNLGRAPLPPAAVEAVVAAAGYCDLELDLTNGQRGSRHEHVEPLLQELTGAQAAMVVNNNAAAVLLALSALAHGREVIVSRGELVEIGGSFRVPEVMVQSGARLVEVGTTNRTRLDDYRRAIGPDTALLLKVHTSNYRLVGFTAAVSVAQLAELGRAHGIPVLYDLGSGALADLTSLAPEEPSVRPSLAAGADLVTFSGDKLLGGPQAGILAGRADLVAACRRHPLARALRVDKLSLAALAAVLRLYLDPQRPWQQVPVLRMLAAPPEQLRSRAEALAARLAERLPGWRLAVEAVAAEAGGGALPGVALPSWAVVLEGSGDAGVLAARLRAGAPPVIARVQRGCLWLDVRTVDPAEEAELVAAVVAAVR